MFNFAYTKHNGIKHVAAKLSDNHPCYSKPVLRVERHQKQVYPHRTMWSFVRFIRLFERGQHSIFFNSGSCHSFNTLVQSSKLGWIIYFSLSLPHRHIHTPLHSNTKFNPHQLLKQGCYLSLSFPLVAIMRVYSHPFPLRRCRTNQK